MTNNNLYGIIYLITNKVNDKKYIGQTTTSLKNRWLEHIYDAKTKRTNMPIHHAMNKYGVHNFIIEKIDSAKTREELNQKEEYYIKQYDTLVKHKNGYNVELGGNNREIHGIPVCQFSLDGKEIETFPSIAVASRKTNTIASGIELCCQGKRRISNNFQWCYAKDKKDFIGTIPKEHQRTFKPVVQYDDNDNVIRIWESATIAGKELGINRQHIYKVCKDERQHCGGYKWKYYNDKDNTPKRHKITNKGKSVQQFSRDGTFIRDFASIVEAERFLGIKQGKSKISEVCNNRRKTSNGFIWRYKNEI